MVGHGGSDFGFSVLHRLSFSAAGFAALEPMCSGDELRPCPDSDLEGGLPLICRDAFRYWVPVKAMGKYAMLFSAGCVSRVGIVRRIVADFRVSAESLPDNNDAYQTSCIMGEAIQS